MCWSSPSAATGASTWGDLTSLIATCGGLLVRGGRRVRGAEVKDIKAGKLIPEYVDRRLRELGYPM
jgi:hypothetical protein